MPERRPSPELRETNPERTNKPEMKEREDRVTQEVARAALLWTEALSHDKRLNDLDLSRERKRGACLVPALLFTAAMGCNQFNKIECGEDDSEFMTASIDWITAHPDEIQIEMDQRWPNQTIQAEDLVNVLGNAEIYCAEPKNPLTMDATAHTNLFNERVIIDVKNDLYEVSLAKYKESQWVDDLYTLDELTDMSNVSNQADQDAQSAYATYLTGLKYVADQLAHEAAHLATRRGHSKTTKKHVNDQGGGADHDEIYAWGHAAVRAAEIESLNAYRHSLE